MEWDATFLISLASALWKDCKISHAPGVIRPKTFGGTNHRSLNYKCHYRRVGKQILHDLFSFSETEPRFILSLTR